jgi:hypothetical protein
VVVPHPEIQRRIHICDGGKGFLAEKKDIFDKMTGNVEEINNPANAFGRVNTYPNAYYTENANGRSHPYADERYTRYKCVVHAGQ